MDFWFSPDIQSSVHLIIHIYGLWQLVSSSVITCGGRRYLWLDDVYYLKFQLLSLENETITGKRAIRKADKQKSLE